MNEILASGDPSTGIVISHSALVADIILRSTQADADLMIIKNREWYPGTSRHTPKPA